jgi:hypothetical protein
MTKKRSAPPHRPPDHVYSARELQLVFRVQRINIISRTITRVVKYVTIAGVASVLMWGAVHIVEAVAGKMTGIGLQWPISSSEDHGYLGFVVDHWRGIFEMLLGIWGGISGYMWRQTHRRAEANIEQLSPFRRKYEQLNDERRTTSGLTGRGNTPSEEDGG